MPLMACLACTCSPQRDEPGRDRRDRSRSGSFGGKLGVEVLVRGRWVALEVADSGEGMSPAVRARATTSFFTTKGARGTGLGLAQAAEFTRAVDGRLVIHSTPDVGTTVTVLLRPS